MDGTAIGLCGIAFLLVVQLVTFAFAYGRLDRQVANSVKDISEVKVEIKTQSIQLVESSRHLAEINGSVKSTSSILYEAMTNIKELQNELNVLRERMTSIEIKGGRVNGG